ncbi:MAG TPA: DUF5916 domain-containing protein, partial [bacterium]|nr:DUF5916 domain-containing protein [bacterium]
MSRVSTFGRVEGFDDLPRPQRFKLVPYATGRVEERLETPAYGFEPTDGWEFEPRYGLDFAYRAGSQAGALVSVLPDYAYIEADPAQINLEPTEIWLEEKRPFFTEGCELFDTYSELLYTRHLTEIAGGAKVTGRAGAMNYGVLDAALKGDDPLYPGDNFAVARASYDLANGSNFGFMGVGRRELGGEVPPGEGTGEDRARYNNVVLADGRVVLPARFGAGVEGAKSETAGEGGDGYMYAVASGRYGITENVEAWVSEVAEDFRADTAFLQPEDLGKRETGFSALKEFQINRGGVRSFRVNGYYEHEWALDGGTSFNFVSPTARLMSVNDLFVTANYRGGRDLRYVPYGYAEFDNDVVDVAVGHAPASWGRVRLGYWRGMWYGEFYHYYTLEVDAIPAPAFVLNGDVELGNPRGGGRFVVGNLKGTHNLTEDLFWRVILQGNSDDRTSSAGVLWGWYFQPGSTA